MLPPTVTVTPENTILYMQGDRVDLTCSVFSDDVDSTVTAITEWQSLSGGTSSQTISTPMSSIIDEDLSLSFNLFGMAVYDCVSYLTSSNDHVIDSDNVTVSKSVRVEGKPYYC